MAMPYNVWLSLVHRPIGYPILCRPLPSPFRTPFSQSVLRQTLRHPRFSSFQAAPPPPPPRRRRRLRRSLFYTALSLASFSLGIYIASLPFTTTLLAAIPRSRTSSASIRYLPSTERSAQIEALINTHPLVQHLRSLPGWSESRPHAQMPELMRRHSLTASTLAGDTKIPVPPVIFTKGQGEELVAISYLGSDLCGHVGIVHGGLLATMLDEGLARCCFAALPNRVGVTARLEIDYRKVCKSEGFVVLKARTERVEGRKAWVRGRVEVLPVGKEARKAKEGMTPTDEVGEVLVEAQGLFVEPKWAKSLPAFVRPPA